MPIWRYDSEGDVELTNSQSVGSAEAERCFYFWFVCSNLILPLRRWHPVGSVHLIDLQKQAQEFGKYFVDATVGMLSAQCMGQHQHNENCTPRLGRPPEPFGPSAACFALLWLAPLKLFEGSGAKAPIAALRLMLGKDLAKHLPGTHVWLTFWMMGLPLKNAGQECRSVCDKANGPQSYIATKYPDTGRRS